GLGFQGLVARAHFEIGRARGSFPRTIDTKDDRHQTGREFRAALVHKSSAVAFAQTLLWEVNVDADESVGRCQLLLDTFTAIINLIGLVSVLRRSSLQEEGPDGAESENNASIRAT